MELRPRNLKLSSSAFLAIEPNLNRAELLEAIADSVIAQARLVATYRR